MQHVQNTIYDIKSYKSSNKRDTKFNYENITNNKGHKTNTFKNNKNKNFELIPLSLGQFTRSLPYRI